LMVKTTDDLVGSVDAAGRISKTLTPDDHNRLQKGTQLAKQILIEAGAKPASLLVSKPQGAHPGGTAAIGQVVDIRLQTRVENLFVCDASVLPAAPGLPPIAAIVALARWFARRF
jgi:choline dehydrogenase-like flavoprotein